MTSEAILRCARLAAVKVEEIHKVLDGALANADAKAALERQVCHSRVSAFGSTCEKLVRGSSECS